MPSNISNDAPRSVLRGGVKRLQGGRPLDVSRPFAGAGNNPPPEPVFLRYPELKRHGVPFSRQHLDTLERRGDFPKRVKLSPGVAVWRLADVRAWLESRAKQSG